MTNLAHSDLWVQSARLSRCVASQLRPPARTSVGWLRARAVSLQFVLVVVVTLACTSLNWVSAQMDPLIGVTNGQEIILVVEGLSVPADGRATTGSELAVEDALRNAVQQVASGYFDQDTLFDNYQRLHDSVVTDVLNSDSPDTDAPDVVRLIRILGQGFGGDGIYRVSAEVGVRQAWLERNLRKLILTNNDTRIVVLSAGSSNAATSTGLLNDLRGHLSELGYSVVMGPSHMPRGLGTTTSIADTALHVGADLALVVDLWSHEDMTPPAELERAGLHSATVSLAFDLVSMADGQVIYSASDARPAAGINLEAAVQSALAELVPPLQGALEQRLANWTQSNLVDSYRLEIADLNNFGQLNNVVDYLDSHAQAVTMRAYDNGVGIVELDYTGAPDELVRLLTQEGLAITHLSGHIIGASIAE
ncbi:MAG: hypothetical protein AAF708_17765 [Deinococcota bacterium]